MHHLLNLNAARTSFHLFSISSAAENEKREGKRGTQTGNTLGKKLNIWELNENRDKGPQRHSQQQTTCKE